MNEITSSRALRYYGAALALTHLLTFYAWFIDHDFARKILEVLFPVCWPFFKNCYHFRPISHSLLNVYFLFYAFVSLASFGCFLSEKKSKIAYFLLFFALLLKCIVVSLDYRFMGNFHYMCLFVQVAYLFFPNKKQLIPILMVSFYLGASFVKFNSQWITGEALLKPTFLKGGFLTAACIYVIFLELALSPLLVVGSNKIALFVFIQFIIFHIFSWHIVGYLYPMMMLLLLCIFPFLWRYRVLSPEDFYLKDLLKKKSLVCYLSVFWVFQTGPLWFEGDSAQTGEGRIFSLNMLDAKVECQEFIFLKYPRKIIEVSDYNLDEGYRIGCDPLLHLSLAKHHCRQRGRNSNFINLDIVFFSKKNKLSPYFELFNFKDFCSLSVDYSLFSKNLWLSEAPLRYRNPVISYRDKFWREGAKTIQEKDDLFLETTKSGWLFAKRKGPKGFTSLWSFYADENIHGLSPRPLVDAWSVYTLSANGRLYSLDRETGALNWVSYVGGELSLNFDQDENNLYLRTRSSKVSVNKDTGEMALLGF